MARSLAVRGENRDPPPVILPLDVHPYSAFYEVVTLAIEGFVLFLLLLFVESRWVRNMQRILTTPEDKYTATAAPAAPNLIAPAESAKVRLPHAPLKYV